MFGAFWWWWSETDTPVISPDPTSLEWDVLVDDLADVYQEITVNGGPFTGLGYTNLSPSLDDGGVFEPQAPVGNVIRVYFLGGSAVGGTGHFYGSFDIVADGAAPVTVQLHAYVHEPVVPPEPEPEAPAHGGGHVWLPEPTPRAKPKRKPKVYHGTAQWRSATFVAADGHRVRTRVGGRAVRHGSAHPRSSSYAFAAGHPIVDLDLPDVMDILAVLDTLT